MASNNFTILNPDTPLAFLLPKVANELEVSRYIYVASLGAFVWDLFSNVPSDFKMLLEYRINISVIAYFLSRITSLAYIILCTVSRVGAIEDCQALEIALGVCFTIAIPSTSLLFLVRIQAIFKGERCVFAVFALLWLAVLGGCITVPFSNFDEHIGPTSHCINTKVKSFSSIGIIVSTVNDTCVMIAITLRILRNASVDDNFQSRFKAFWNGGPLPRFSKSIMQSGQQYYLITVAGNIATMVMILSPSVPAVYRGMFTVPNTLIENSMACKVYRDIRLGYIQELSLTSTMHQASMPNIMNAAAPRHLGPGQARLFRKASVPEHITITKTVEHTTDMIPMEVSLNHHSASRNSSLYDSEDKADVNLGHDIV